VRRGQKAAGLYREDGRAAEGQTFGEFGLFLLSGATGYAGLPFVEMVMKSAVC
jgi:hypothetical protein